MNDLSRDLRLIAHPFTGPEMSKEARQTLIDAANEIFRLEVLVAELTPFLLLDIEFAVNMGGPSPEHPKDDCEDCQYYERVMAWKKRVDAGELGQVNPRV